MLLLWYLVRNEFFPLISKEKTKQSKTESIHSLILIHTGFVTSCKKFLIIWRRGGEEEGHLADLSSLAVGHNLKSRDPKRDREQWRVRIFYFTFDGDAHHELLAGLLGIRDTVAYIHTSYLHNIHSLLVRKLILGVLMWLSHVN